MRPEEWLATPWEGRLPFEYEDAGDPTIPDAPSPSRGQVLACLVYRNGGALSVSGWGSTTSGGAYRHYGIAQSEGLALMQMTAFLEGMCLASGGDLGAAWRLIEAEVMRVQAIRGIS